MAYDYKQLSEKFDSKVKAAQNAINTDYELQALLDNMAEDYRRDIGMYTWQVPGKMYTIPEKYDPMFSLTPKSDAVDRLAKLEKIRKAVNELLCQDLEYHIRVVAKVKDALTAAAASVLDVNDRKQESAENM